MIGQIIAGKYNAIEELSQGGLGKTYLAENTCLSHNNKCVIKQLKPKNADEYTLKEAKKRFPIEARVLKKLGKQHRQIPQLIDFFEEENEFFIVQELIEGYDLDREIVEGKQLEESKVNEILIELLEILAFVHDRNIIHRDIKPSNVMRRKIDNRLVLIDFGIVKEIATQVSDFKGQTSLTKPIGTRGYMPIEQSLGKPKLSSDLYALGMMAIFALTGVHPKKIPENRETGEIVWRDLIDVSPKLANFIDKMVRYQYYDRYSSAAEALKALKEINGEIPSAIDETPPTDNSSWFPRFKPYLITSSLVLLLGSFLFIRSSEIASICSTLNNCSQNIELQEEYQRIVELATPTLTAIENSPTLSNLDWKELAEFQNQIEKLIAELETIPQNAKVSPQVKETIRNWDAQLNRINQEMEIRPIWE